MKRVFGNATLYLGDCYERVADLLAADVVLTDPPYGIKYKVNRRAPRSGIKGLKAMSTEAKNAIIGDDKPFDPSPWLPVPRVAFFGANYFAPRLPAGGKWIVWDKRAGMSRDSHSDCELVWTNAPGALRVHRQKWRGVCREGEENCSRSKKLHPNQKPVALLGYILSEMKIPTGVLVADPYMGSGSTAVAALRAGMRFVGCEIDPGYYEIACNRVAYEVAFGG